MKGFQTRAIHAGVVEKDGLHALNPPIYQTSTFTFENLAHAEDVMDFRSTDYVYTRGNNPTLRLLENRVADLEGGAGAVAFSSGMGAISSVLFSLLKPGERILANRTLYGSTYGVITHTLKHYGVENTLIDLRDRKALEESFFEDTKVVYFETPSNPNVDILDIREIATLAHANGAWVVVDNTFASPYLQNPLELGADIVVHSATKYLSGHGDVVAGIAVAKNADYIHRLKFEYMCEFGTTMSPFNAWLILRGLKTLPLRMRTHCENARAVANFLKNHKGVETIHYPGLESDPGHEVAKKQMRDYGGIITFEPVGGIEAARKIVENLELFQLAVSLGDCESLVEIPSVMTHRGYPKEKLQEFGFTESTVRLSIGLEDSEDLIEDLEKAFEK